MHVFCAMLAVFAAALSLVLAAVLVLVLFGTWVFGWWQVYQWFSIGGGWNYFAACSATLGLLAPIVWLVNLGFVAVEKEWYYEKTRARELWDVINKPGSW